MIKIKALRNFEFHGVVFNGSTGGQAYGDCPFSGCPGKFYVSIEKQLWDCKKENFSGNVYQFYERIAELNATNTPLSRLKKLADQRKMPVAALKAWHVGWDGTRYTLPVRDIQGRVVDIRYYRLRSRLMSTPGAATGLIGSHVIKERPQDPIYL